MAGLLLMVLLCMAFFWPFSTYSDYSLIIKTLEWRLEIPISGKMERMNNVIVLCMILAASLGANGVTTARSIVFGETTHIIGRDGLCLDVVGGFDNDHMPTQLWPCGSQKNQLWTILTDGTIRALGKCLIPYGNSIGDYAMINDCDNSTTDAKTWNFSADGTLFHVHSALVLTAKTAGEHTMPTIENNTYAANQRWDATQVLAPMVTRIMGLHRMCLQAQNDNNVWLNTCAKGRKQQYWAVYGDGTIRANFDPNLCLTSIGKSSGDLIILSNCEGSTRQRWEQEDKGTIVNPNTDLVMDVKESDPSLHQIILYERNGYVNQQWMFSK